MTRIAVVLKTNEGGLWAVPQVDELRSRGHTVTVVIPPGNGKLRRLLDTRGIPVIDSSFDFSFRPSLHLVRGLWRLRRQLRDFEPDVVFYHLYASALAVRLSTLFIKLRRVHMVAGPLYLDSSVIRFAERFLCRSDDIVIGGSEHTAQRYLEIGMPAHRIRAIPYGVNIDQFDRLGVVPIDPRPATFTAIMVAYVYAPKSAVYPGVGIKGHEILLDAWKKFATAFPNSRLILVGAGFDDDGERHRTSLKDRWSSVLVDSVIWVDSVDDVRAWYASADVSISPSLSENHGAALEASAMGLPSIVSDAGALPETVLPGETGWIVQAGDIDATSTALAEAHGAWLDGELVHMGSRARGFVNERFDQETCARLVADVVEAT